MATEIHPHTPIDSIILGEAVDWVMRIQSAEMTEHDRLSFERWRKQSAIHAAAWERAEGVLNTFSQAPVEISRHTFSRLKKPSRRHALWALGAFSLAAPAAWELLQTTHNKGLSLHTATGEQATHTLADGTSLIMNTATSVSIDFTPEARVVHLHEGEIAVTTAVQKSDGYRPFMVTTPHGVLRALGTRFNVKSLDGERTQVAVFEGAVEVSPTASSLSHVLTAGQQLWFDRARFDNPDALDAAAVLWQDGMLVAKSMRLETLLQELARYRKGILRCDPAVADMVVSGAFPLTDIELSLRLLQQTLPLRIARVTDYWLSVRAI